MRTLLREFRFAQTDAPPRTGGRWRVLRRCAGKGCRAWLIGEQAGASKGDDLRRWRERRSKSPGILPLWTGNP